MTRSFLTSDNVPLGYTTPKFPSLFWPLGPSESLYHASFLYYTRDIWVFTVAWTVIFFAGFHLAAGVMLCFNNSRRSIHVGLSYIVIYVFLGSLQGFISGSVCGIILAEIYKSGKFSMSTWIPLVWAIIQIIFAIITSYSMTSVAL